jgi:hypothetical protein
LALGDFWSYTTLILFSIGLAGLLLVMTCFTVCGTSLILPCDTESTIHIWTNGGQPIISLLMAVIESYFLVQIFLSGGLVKCELVLRWVALELEDISCSFIDVSFTNILYLFCTSLARSNITELDFARTFTHWFELNN